jgi:hypothetical protein
MQACPQSTKLSMSTEKCSRKEGIGPSNSSRCFSATCEELLGKTHEWDFLFPVTAVYP